ncbi:Dbl homology domain-containing protein [Zopfochytrium polystomum]|nr:Dbl homology domain-containing protein [Zopfochytrium polystomum]
MGEVVIQNEDDQLPPLLRCPLYSADAMVLIAPHLVDAISSSLPQDAWDWQSIPMFPQSSPTPGSGPSMPDIDPSLTVEQNLVNDPIDKKRGHAILEILTTERNYYQDLGIIKNVCRQRLVERDILSKISVTKIFAGMDELYALHTLFLSGLEEIVSIESWSPTHSSIGRIFIEHKDEMVKHYITYINHHQSSMKTIQEEEEKNPAFQKFLQECLRSNETKRTELKELMLRPMQRMTKYPLLIKELAKRTPDEHPDAVNLASAREAMAELAATVNEKMRTSTMQTALFAAFERILNCPPTLVTARRSCLTDVEAADRSGRRLQLFLCSDLLMVAAYREDKNAAGGGRIGFGGKKDQGQSQNVPLRTQPLNFVRWIDLAELSFEEIAHDFLRFTVSDRSINSLTTPGLPDTFDVKIDGSAFGSQRKVFIQTMSRELAALKKSSP